MGAMEGRDERRKQPFLGAYAGVPLGMGWGQVKKRKKLEKGSWELCASPPTSAIRMQIKAFVCQLLGASGQQLARPKGWHWGRGSSAPVGLGKAWLLPQKSQEEQ